MHQAFPFIAPRHISVPHPYCFSFSTYCMLCWLFLLAAGFTNHPKHNFRLSFFYYFNKRVCILACGKYRCLSKWSKPMYQCSPHYPNELTVEASDKGTSRLALNYSPYIQFMYKRNIREILLSLCISMKRVCECQKAPEWGHSWLATNQMKDILLDRREKKIYINESLNILHHMLISGAWSWFCKGLIKT